MLDEAKVHGAVGLIIGRFTSFRVDRRVGFAGGFTGSRSKCDRVTADVAAGNNHAVVIIVIGVGVRVARIHRAVIACRRDDFNNIGVGSETVKTIKAATRSVHGCDGCPIWRAVVI